MRLNPNIDLTEIAQYYEDKFGRQGLNSLVFNEFDKIPKNNENINWLSKMLYQNIGRLTMTML